MVKLFPSALVLNVAFFRSCLAAIALVIAAFTFLHVSGFGRPR